MKRIFKYEMNIQEKQTLMLPPDSHIIRVDDVEGRFYLWAMVTPEAENDTSRRLEFYKTGQDIENPEGLIYLGFCKLFIMQELGLYVFERIS